ncbi:glycosyltransferase [Cupriavidus sp. IK-TO18]|uniref:glycosyltransferase n=1 Tax=Cupriavidus sp. IK-TO18 TaxID=2782182 RepID=UPI0034CD9629
MEPTAKLLTISLVSHGQWELMRPLIGQLSAIAGELPLQVIVTENLREQRGADDGLAGLDVRYIQNTEPKGFGANHNAAFAYCNTPYFCVVNPDVRLIKNPFPALLAQVRARPGVVAPRVVAEDGTLEDSARKVPRPSILLQRALARLMKRRLPPDYTSEGTIPVDWAAGMFLLFDAQVFKRLGGFDDRYHLYCEDVDVCLRTWLNGGTVSWANEAIVMHDARRDSHRRFRYLRWHLASMLRLFTSSAYWRFRFGNVAARQMNNY